MKLPWYLNMYISTHVPWWAIVGIVLITLISLCLFRKHKWLVLLIAYSSFIVCHTLIFRTASSDVRCILEPFWNYRTFSGNEMEDFGEIVMNVLFYVPVGFTSYGCLKEFNGNSHFTTLRAVMIGMFLSLIIEMFQFFFHRGLCETDDVIHNTLGSLIGCWIFVTFSWLVERLKAVFKLTIDN